MSETPVPTPLIDDEALDRLDDSSNPSASTPMPWM